MAERLTDPERLAVLEERARSTDARVVSVEDVQDEHIRHLIETDAWKMSVTTDLTEIKTTLKRLDRLDKRLAFAVTLAAFLGPTVLTFLWDVIRTTAQLVN